MCGIIAYVGEKNAVEVVLDGLERLEYRGYDSAGISFFEGEKLRTVKKKGRVKVVGRLCDGAFSPCAIGHTRWATHGAPSDNNAHPHNYNGFSVVHNGIIENFAALKADLEQKGEVFTSQTDSEIIAHLLTQHYRGDLLNALQLTTKQLEGSFAIVALCEAQPGTFVVARRNAPVVLAQNESGCFVASDAVALASHAKKTYWLPDDCYAVVTREKVCFYDKNARQIELQSVALNFAPESLSMQGHDTYMHKEIYQVPDAILATYEAHKVFSPPFERLLLGANRIIIVACGTAYHSAIVGKMAIEKLSRVPVEVEIASEFCYKQPIFTPNTLLIAISQSGETADTLLCAAYAKKHNVPVVAITNVENSSVTRYADFVLHTKAGVEIGVAATKSYTAQLCMLYLIALGIAKQKGGEVAALYRALESCAALAKQTLSCAPLVENLAKTYCSCSGVFFIGRGYDYAVALEGSLKLKEISYLHSEGYAAGELKHGTIALIEKNTLVIALMTDKELLKKTLNAAAEVKARGACVIAVTCFDEVMQNEIIDKVVYLPPCESVFAPLLSVIPLQLFAYYAAVVLGKDPDKPRNLAKSVTVE